MNLNLEQFPTTAGVYLMKDNQNVVIYVGKAKNLKNRLKNYFSSSGDNRLMVPFLIQQIHQIDTIVVPNEKEALLLENTLIKKHQPKYNAILKDDKTFISLMINHKHPWPMLKLIRYKGPPKQDGLYFGPYTSAFAARQTYELLTKLFPLRQCSDEELKKRTRPCLLYGMKRCIAPCVNKCTHEEYDNIVKRTIQFLKGQDKQVLKELYIQMQEASDQMRYELAASLLQTIRQIEHVIDSNSIVVNTETEDTDVLALYRQAEEMMLVQLLFREGKLVGSEHYSFSNILEDDEALLSSFLLQHYLSAQTLPKRILLPFSIKDISLIGEILHESQDKKILLTLASNKKHKALVQMAEENAKALFKQKQEHRLLKEKMLLDLAETLKLTRYPKQIVCFDTSNISGTDPVASLVTFTDGTLNPKYTRLYKIKTVTRSDDYTALREVIHRYLTRAKQEDALPDLLIVDGGKGQLNIALEIFKELDIASVDLIALTKEEGRHDKGMTNERVFLPNHHDPIYLNPRSNLLFLLQQIRDEAHRKALQFHQKRRTKRTLKSSLDSIPGIGSIKRTRLLHHFGSVKKIKEATESELKQVKGITQRDINAIHKKWDES